jgi:hypothetical protein
LNTSLIISVSLLACFFKIDETVTSEAMYLLGSGTVHCVIDDERVKMLMDELARPCLYHSYFCQQELNQANADDVPVHQSDSEDCEIS